MRVRAMRLALCAVIALTLLTVGVASASLPKPYKPDGGYKVVVTGTGTLELNLASAPWACGGQAENLILLKGAYRSTLAAKGGTVHRARVRTKKKLYSPYGAVAPFTVSGTWEETYNDYTACPPILGTGGPATRTCIGGATKALSSATHQLVIFGQGKRVLISVQTNIGDRRTDGFPGPVRSCGGLPVLEDHPIEISEQVPNSKFKGKRGSVVLAKSAPVAFQRTFPFPGTSYAPLSYTGTATYQLKIDWKRTRKGPGKKNTGP